MICDWDLLPLISCAPERRLSVCLNIPTINIGTQALKAVICGFAQVSHFIHVFASVTTKKNYRIYLKTFIYKHYVMLKVLELVPGKMHLDFD